MSKNKQENNKEGKQVVQLLLISNDDKYIYGIVEDLLIHKYVYGDCIKVSIHQLFNACMPALCKETSKYLKIIREDTEIIEQILGEVPMCEKIRKDMKNLAAHMNNAFYTCYNESDKNKNKND